jgi:DNA-binding response OmpR family regulator
MPSLKLIYEEDNSILPELIKNSLEATGKFIVLIENESFEHVFQKPSKKNLPVRPALFGNFLFDNQARTLQWKEEKPQKMTNKENKILLLLLENAGSIVTRSLILSSLWGVKSLYTSRSLDIFIYHLRKMLKKDPSVVIQTIRGEGFLLSY